MFHDLIESFKEFMRDYRRRAWKRKRTASIQDPFSN